MLGRLRFIVLLAIISPLKAQDPTCQGAVCKGYVPEDEVSLIQMKIETEGRDASVAHEVPLVPLREDSKADFEAGIDMDDAMAVETDKKTGGGCAEDCLCGTEAECSDAKINGFRSCIWVKRANDAKAKCHQWSVQAALQASKISCSGAGCPTKTCYGVPDCTCEGYSMYSHPILGRGMDIASEKCSSKSDYGWCNGCGCKHCESPATWQQACENFDPYNYCVAAGGDKDPSNPHPSDAQFSKAQKHEVADNGGFKYRGCIWCDCCVKMWTFCEGYINSGGKYEIKSGKTAAQRKTAYDAIKGAYEPAMQNSIKDFSGTKSCPAGGVAREDWHAPK